MHNLCKCGHDWFDHSSCSMELDGTFSSYIGACRHDQAIFKGMCTCWKFQEADNLTRIELLAKQKGLV
jgi:hypothetical protein